LPLIPAKPLCRGAVAASLNDMAGTEKTLRIFIRDNPRTDQASRAFDVLEQAREVTVDLKSLRLWLQ